MKENEFIQRIQVETARRLGTSYEVVLKEVTKNNGIILQGLLIYKKGGNISPTIYLESFENEYNRGVPIESIIDRILELYEQYVPQQSLDMSFFLDFEKVKDGIMYKLINAENNRALLEEIPHICFLDLAICFYYDFSNEEIGKGSILIRNDQVSCWDTCTKELMQLAQKNTGTLGVELVLLRDLLEEKEEYSELQVWVLSNHERNFGAAAMIQPGMLEEIAEKLEGSLYILPSSVHEVILLRDDGEESATYLQWMVSEVNRAHVLPEEILSDHIYYYRRETGKLEMLETD